MGMAEIAGGGLLVLASAGIAYTLAAAWLVGRFHGQAFAAVADAAVTVLKPLHGGEPRLRENLLTLLAQSYDAPVQVVCGVRDAGDPAAQVVAALQRDHPAADLTLVIDATRHGSNAKLSNVVNIAKHARHPLVVLADSDVAWPPDTLRRLAAALDEPGVGLASCLHGGRSDAGFWSRLGAMDISYRFMPSVALAWTAGLAQPCLGPTMALRRETLDAVGGFRAFADELADDYALGTAVRGLRLRLAVPRFTIVHACSETGLAELVRHELRWTRTIYGIDPLGFAGSGVTHCLVLAAAGAALTGGAWGLATLAAATAARVVLKVCADRVTGVLAGPLYLLPLRDLLSFAVFAATFFVTSVEWRGSRYGVSRDGRLTPREKG